MSALLQLLDISFARHHLNLFSNINLTINPSDRVGLVGRNGCGKSSLLSLISGDEKADGGEIRMPRGLNIATVDQFIKPYLLTMGLLEAVSSVYQSDDIMSLRWKAESQLLALGFSEEQFSITVENLSGGQQNLLLIAMALLREPELLLMDEPGNHMDIVSLNRLQDFLASQCNCPFIIISHDRHLLNTVCNKTVFIRDLQTYQYDLAFDDALKKLDEHDKHAEKNQRMEKMEIKRLRDTAKRLEIWGREHDNEKFSRKAKSIVKRADKLDNEKTAVSTETALTLNLESSSLSAKQILTLENVDIMIPGQPRKLLSIDQLVVRPGDAIAILGINGVGKSSTLEKIRKKYSSDNRQSGSIRFNPRVNLAYYDQGLSTLSDKHSRIDWLRNQTNSSEQEIKKTLINSGVDYEGFSRTVDSLSGGEKARMMFMSFQLNRPNLMILDEPSNHIDLFGKQQLIEQLKASGATLIVTSHDRYFLEKITNRWLWIDRGKLQEIQHGDLFYNSLQPQTSKADTYTEKDTDKQFLIPMTETDILEKIEELEVKLKKDQLRKIKFQKPQQQMSLKKHIDELWSKLS